ncbi:hypothetical protein PMAYCL1PPCAC_27934, partial [Pristionchus mayeri]
WKVRPAFKRIFHLYIDMDRSDPIDGHPVMRVRISGHEDPIIEQVTNLLSSSIKCVFIGANGIPLSSFDLSLCSQLLGASTIDHLQFDYVEILDDTTIPLIFSIISRATNSLSITVRDRRHLIYPAIFIATLYSFPIAQVVVLSARFDSFFFGLPRNFWEEFLNENLSNGEIEWVVTMSMTE